MSFDAFGPLDDIIQVIYQGTSRFVLLSKVNFDTSPQTWEIHIGVVDLGRWWESQWSEKDARELLNNDFNEDNLELLADEIAEAIINRHLTLDGWTTPPPERGCEDIKIIINPNGFKPFSLSLKEVSESEAVLFTTNTLLSLGLSAQQRKCRMNPPTYVAPAVSTTTVTNRKRVLDSLPKARARSRSPQEIENHTLNEKEHVSEKPVLPTNGHETSVLVTSKPKRKSASIQASNAKTQSKIVKKKARTVQAMEFASDEES